MASIPGFRLDITGASGSQGLLSPRDGWRAYVFPRGGNAAQDSTGTLITFDSAAIADRFAVNNWVQVGTDTAKIVRVTAVGGNSMSVNSAVVVSENDRVFLIGNTQPSVSGGSATYITPNTLVRQRGDDAADLYSNSMITTNANGLVQAYASPAVYDVMVQDGNGSNQGYVQDLMVGLVEGLSITDWAFFGSTVTMHGALGVTGNAAFGQSVTISGTLHSTRGPGAVRYASQFSSGSSTGGIQEAIDDLPFGGGKVILSAGTTYSLTAEITGRTFLEIEGSGPSSLVLQTVDGLAGIVIRNSSSIRNLTLRGTNVSMANAHGIDGGDNFDCLVENCTIEQWGRIGVNFANGSSRCVVRNNIIRDGWSEGIYFGLSTFDNQVVDNLVYNNDDNGIDFIGTRGRVSGNIVRNNGTVGPGSDNNGIIVGSGSSYSATDVIVSENVCIGNARDGIFVWGSGIDIRRIVVSNNVCRGNSQRGIRLEGISGTTFGQHVVTGNIISGNVAQNLLLDGVDDTLVEGNVISDGLSHGLHLYATTRGCSRNIVTGNIIRGNSNNGIVGDHSSVTGCIIRNNQVSGNGTDIGTFSSASNIVANNSPATSTLTQAASLALGNGDFFGISGTLGAGTSISAITPLSVSREVTLWSAAGTMGFSSSNALRIIGNSINVPVNGAVKAFCTGTTWFIFSPSS